MSSRNKPRYITDNVRGSDRRARPHAFHGLRMDLLLQVLQPMEDSMLPDHDDYMRYPRGVVLGLCFRLHRLQAHLAHGSLHACLRDQSIHVQAMLFEYHRSLHRTVLPVVRNALQPV